VSGRLAVTERLRFYLFTFERLPGSRCRARVVLSWADGREFGGESDGVAGGTGELRCSAQATVEALSRAVERGIQLELLGVKAVRAFDATVVIVSLSANEQGKVWRMVGSYLTETDPPRAAALAVLNATNRVLGNYVTTR
jgi:hypothetical protein